MLGAVAGAIAVAACVDLSAPKGSPASISQIQLAAFFVVQGDTMRDTLGVATPPTVKAFDGAGNAITTFTPAFFITDTVQQLHFSASNGALVANGPADTVGATAHIVGQLGGLQTAAQPVYITVRPDTLERSNQTALDSLPVAFTEDSASGIKTVTLSTVVHGVAGKPVPGVFVRYTLTTPVASKGASPASYLRDDGNKVFLAGQSAADTGSSSGETSRTLVVNSALVASDKFGKTDTLVVVATAMYKGVPLAGSPLRILVPTKFFFP